MLDPENIVVMRSLIPRELHNALKQAAAEADEYLCDFVIARLWSSLGVSPEASSVLPTQPVPPISKRPV